MGCDIHLYREKLVDGKWVEADLFKPCRYGEEGLHVDYDDKSYTGRNYNLFGMLSAGVRGNDFEGLSIEMKGLPDDVSPLVKEASNRWGIDGHSHSYLTLAELKELKAKMATVKIPIGGMMPESQYKEFSDSLKSGEPNWDLLYPYCAWTNMEGYVEFREDVPAEFIAGASLDTIIEGLEAVGGEDQRAVFWFDN